MILRGKNHFSELKSFLCSFRTRKSAGFCGFAKGEIAVAQIGDLRRGARQGGFASPSTILSKAFFDKMNFFTVTKKTKAGGYVALGAAGHPEKGGRRLSRSEDEVKARGEEHDVAEGREVLAYLTSVLRGEAGKELQNASARMKAAELLAKRTGVLEEDGCDGGGRVVIIDDVHPDGETQACGDCPD